MSQEVDFCCSWFPDRKVRDKAMMGQLVSNSHRVLLEKNSKQVSFFTFVFHVGNLNNR